MESVEAVEVLETACTPDGAKLGVLVRTPNVPRVEIVVSREVFPDLLSALVRADSEAREAVKQATGAQPIYTLPAAGVRLITAHAPAQVGVIFQMTLGGDLALSLSHERARELAQALLVLLASGADGREATH